MEAYIPLISAVIISIVAPAIAVFLARRKTNAETQNTTATSEVLIGKAWQEYAERQVKDNEKQHAQCKEEIDEIKKMHTIWAENLEGKYNNLEKKHDILQGNNDILQKSYDDLSKKYDVMEKENVILKDQLVKYQARKEDRINQINVAKEEIKEKVDEKMEEIKTP